MNLIKITDYKGFDISYVISHRHFVLTHKDQTEELRDADSQEKLEKLADSLITATKKLKPPIEAFVYDWRIFRHCEITSYDPQNNEVWATTGKGRGKYRLDNIYIASESNLNIMNSMEEKRRKITQLDKENEILKSELVKITPEYFEVKEK